MPPSSLNKGEKFLLFVQITTVQNNKFEISILADFKYVFRNTCEPFGKVKQRIMYFCKALQKLLDTLKAWYFTSKEVLLNFAVNVEILNHHYILQYTLKSSMYRRAFDCWRSLLCFGWSESSRENPFTMKDLPLPSVHISMGRLNGIDGIDHIILFLISF